ncbi:hypothetical protein H6G33_28510 [Calothrix sp. FACHB-1219]|uniref:hypothetical protein n=1 Tax=unclassified Calothrix TaxID=2619626 RepID=UPI0016877948|nr:MULTISPECIES: hypothetical protein [unclassified Calothrix]MBD2204109.1 hypothetical protein [Calothrix sp. FACHB-168]MBD2220923.1 hypothetical protein [Calothrix sp. FACHB-1219]
MSQRRDEPLSVQVSLGKVFWDIAMILRSPHYAKLYQFAKRMPQMVGHRCQLKLKIACVLALSPA